MYEKCEENSGTQQFGFKGGYGCREALCAVNVLAQRCRDVNRKLYLCFIDYKKAFDCVKHKSMMKALEEAGIGPGTRKLVHKLYWDQTATIRWEGEESEEVPIQKGVRQGCILSPAFFNVYSEAIFKRAIKEDDGFRIDGSRVSNIRYADDTVLIAETLSELQDMLARVADISAEYGLEINVKKTKWMVIHKKRDKAAIEGQQLKLDNALIERVTKFQYLGTWLQEETDQTVEIRSRIEKARKAFVGMRNLMTRKDLSLALRMRLVRCYVWSTLLYGMESWVLNRALEKKIEALEMYIYRRMLRISYRDHITNVEVLRRMSKEPELLGTIQKRKLEYYGHVCRNTEKYSTFQLILRGKINGKRSVGRRKLSWESDLRRWFKCSPKELFKAAGNKIRIAMLITKLRTETV